MTESLRLLVGDWLVLADATRIERGGESVALEPRAMAVLLTLCRRPGEVVSADALVHACWPDSPIGDNPVHKAIAALRRAFQDSATEPAVIETIRKQGYRLLAPVRVLSGHGARDLRGRWDGDSPFRGLEPFDQAHSSVFFGRDAAVEDLHARLDQQHARGRPLVVLLGPSGSGKTSLVHAGLTPALFSAANAPARGLGGSRISAFTVATVDLGTADELGPWAALAGGLLDWELRDMPLLSGHSIESLAAELRRRPESVERWLRVGLQTVDVPGRPLLILDRLEALFMRTDPADVHAFVAILDTLVASGLILVVAICRNDFYPALAMHPALMRDKQHGAHMDLAPPGPEAIAQMIRLPAQAAGLVFGRDEQGLNRLDDRLCADALQAGDALPLLQYTLHELYLRRNAGGELTWAAYDALGGIEGAVGRRAEEIISQMPVPQQEALGRVFPRLVGLSRSETAVSGRWVAERTLADPHERALVQALVQARLLVADHLQGLPGVRVAHEALLRTWPRATAWVAQHRALLGLRDDLQPWAQRWIAEGSPASLLLPDGAMLWQMSAAVAEAPALFSGDEAQYVARSQARVRRLARWRLAATAGCVSLAMVAAVAAWRSTELARVASAREQQSQQLASFMLGDLADQLRPVGKLDLLVSLGEQGLRVLGADATSPDSPADALQRAKALVVIGETQGSRGKGRTDLAVAALEQARHLLRPLEEERGVDTAAYYKTLGAADFWRGQIAFDSGDLAQAAAEMARYRETCERWRRRLPADLTARAELGFALNSLGSIALRRGAWAEAARWFGDSLTLKLTVLAENPNDREAQDAVASSRTWLAIVARARGDARQAITLLDEALATQRALQTAYPAEFVRMHDLGALQMRRSEALRDLGAVDAAERAMADAVAWIDRSSANDPSNAHWQSERAHAFGAWLLARLDAGLPVDDRLTALDDQMERLPASAGASEFTVQLTRAVRALVHASLAARRSDRGAALDRLDQGEQRVSALVGARPRYWHSRELQARFVLLRLSLPDSTPARMDYCARVAAELQPVVAGGQGGLVREAWQAAIDCHQGGGREPAARSPRQTATPLSWLLTVNERI